jgi:hypothetical protein
VLVLGRSLLPACCPYAFQSPGSSLIFPFTCSWPLPVAF